MLHASGFATPREPAAMPAGQRERGATPSNARGGTHERRPREAARPLRIAGERPRANLRDEQTRD